MLKLNVLRNVTIRETDVVSKLVCRRCCILAIKIYKYRTKAVANDKVLKEQCGQHYSPPPSPPLSPFDTCKNKSSGDSSEIGNTNHHNVSFTQNTKFGLIKKHPSVEELMSVYPNIILPSRIFQSHINPVITIDKNEVTEWFQKHRNLQYDLPLVAINECYSKFKNITIRKVISKTENFEIANEDDASKNQLNNVPCKNAENVNKEDAKSKSFSSCNIVTECRVVSNNVARKRTSGIRTYKRKMERKKNPYETNDSDAEIMPTAKRKTPIMTNEVQKEIFTSSLGLTPSDKRLITEEIDADVIYKTSPSKSVMFETLKEVNLFVCNICNRVCDTRKELTEHQRIHLHCKFCKTKVKSIDALLEHNNETCFVNLTKNLPNVVLLRADKDPKMINKYRKAFETLKDEQEESDEYENSEIIPLIEEVNVPVGGGEFLDELQTNAQILPSYTNEILMPEPDDRVDLKNPMLRSVLANNLSNEKHSEDSKLEQYIERSIGRATQKSKRKVCSTSTISCSNENVVCISDESGDETTTNNSTKIAGSKINDLIEDVTVVPPVESVSIIRPEIKIAQNTIVCPQATQAMNSKSLASLEESLIQDLFKKYSISKSTNRTTQVFLPSDSSIKVLGNKLMSVENMFLELNMHKVPVELNFSDVIKIDFKRAIEKAPYKSDFSWNKCSINELMPHHLSTAALKRQPVHEVIHIEDDGFISPAAATVTTASPSDWSVISENNIPKNILVSNPDVRTDTIPTTFIQPTVLLNGSSFLPNNNNKNSSNNQTITIPLIPKISSSSNNQSKLINQCSNTVQVVVPTSNPHIQAVSVPHNHVQVSTTSSNTILLNHINAISRPSSGQKLLLPRPFFTSSNVIQQTSLSPNITCSETHKPSVGAITSSNCGKIILITHNQNKTVDQNDTNVDRKVESLPAVETTNCTSSTTTEKIAVQGSSGPSLLRVRNLWELTGHKS
ncbi:uncharacterized protein LOC108742806 isoform X2 [Agrilus planipennis]|uniref:Uncharacterized protein LOC108742806 isoform X2 n=1 Tax=Agrilus planipennis TaxID=224129 RepID=A0A1W4XMC5_AGRPL|nr:uncharacterized protein LOC108742806 isoform X2 [Agrilus planipennis]